MTLQELITLLENKLTHTSNQKLIAEQRGDIQLAEELNEQIINTQLTLDQLKTLS